MTQGIFFYIEISSLFINIFIEYNYVKTQQLEYSTFVKAWRLFLIAAYKTNIPLPIILSLIIVVQIKLNLII